MDYKDIRYLTLAAPLAKVGVGYGLMPPLFPSPPAASVAVYFQSPEAKSAEPQNRERIPQRFGLDPAALNTDPR
jgi:hypothetical protein